MVNGSQMTFAEFFPEISQEQTYGVQDSPAKTSLLQDTKWDFKASVLASYSELCTFLRKYQRRKNPMCYSLRTLKILCLLMEDGTSPDFSLHWTTKGTMYSGKFSIPKTSYHKTERGCTLSDILEPEVDEMYFLSSRTTQRLLAYDDAMPLNEVISDD